MKSLYCDQNDTPGKGASATGRNNSATGEGATAMGAYTTASGYQSTAMGCATTASGQASTANGHFTRASGSESTAMGAYTTASGLESTAMGRNTNALDDCSTAMGVSTEASGVASTAMGLSTTASDCASTAMGCQTTASGAKSTAMGLSIEAKAEEALVNSGTINGKSLTFFADERLVAGVQAVDTAAMLRNVRSLKVVSHTPSVNYCRHQNRAAEYCAGDRTVGLLAQHVGAVVQGAVASVSSLKLTDGNHTHHEPEHGRQAEVSTAKPSASPTRSLAPPPAATVLEHVESVQSLDVHVLVAQLVGAVQAQSTQMEAQTKQIEAQSKQNEAQSKQIEVQSKQIEAQSKQIEALNVKMATITNPDWIPGTRAAQEE